MSYKDKPIIKLYKWENNSFVMQAQIDDFQEVSFEHTIYQAGTFTITINYNIPNALKFERGLFVQIGNNPYDFGEIITIQDSIGEDGKGSQTRTITGYDARYILKRRVIKNMNSNGLWVMTDKGELVLRNLIKDQCGAGAEAKRQLPITNTIPASSSAIGKDYSVSEQFSNLYEVCKTIATQSEIGWRFAFDGSGLTLEVYEGTDRSQTVKFDTSFESLANGDFTDSSDSFSNAIYVGGKGQNDDRDIYEGEDVSAGTPSGLDRFESWDNQSAMTTESEYEAEALSMLTQYGQTLTMSGNGLAKCPYVFREEYDIGDLVTVAFSGKSAVAQILSITEHWSWGAYDIQFSFGKPQNNLADQLQLMLRKIQEASNKTNSTDSVKWYTIPTDTAMPKADVTYSHIGFIGTVNTGATFTLYLDNEKTGAKTYHVYFKQLGGTGKLTLTTGKAGATNLEMMAGTYVAIIYVDENGNITNTASTPTDTIAVGNTLPATSGGVAEAISSATASPNVSNATGTLGVSHGGTGQTSLANVSVGSADKWTTARNIKIQDSDGTNTGSAVSVDGSANKTLKLPSTIKATLSGNASTATKVEGTYTGSGGQQNPRYVGKNRVCFNMMNTTVNGNSQYKDWLMMDCYSGFDVGGTVALGINRQALGAYIMRANAGTSPNRPTSWADSAELLHTKNLLNILYPVGAIYLTISSSDFSNFLGGTWKKVTDGRFIRASGTNAGSVPTIAQINAGTGTQAEGLPNITGSIQGTDYSIGSNTGVSNSGALKGEEFNKKTSSGTSQSASYMSKISFNASDGNSTVPQGASSGKIYGNSSHVTPYNMAVYMWVRTA